MALSFEKYKPEIDKYLKSLQRVKDVTSYDVYEALWELQHATFRKFTNPRAYGLYLVNEGFGQLFLDLWNGGLSQYVKNKDRGSDGYRNVEMLLSLLWNTTDKSQKVGDDLVAHGCVLILLEVIKNENDLDDKFMGGGILGTLNNIIHMSTKHRSVYREANAIDILQPFLKSKNVQIQTKALMAMAYVVNDKEREILAISKAGLKQLLVLLKQGVDNEEHKGTIPGTCNTFSVLETLDAINQLAINDATKAEVARQGAIPAIVRMLEDDFSSDEQQVAVSAMWNLSFVESIRKSLLVTVPG